MLRKGASNRASQGATAPWLSLLLAEDVKPNSKVFLCLLAPVEGRLGTTVVAGPRSPVHLGGRARRVPEAEEALQGCWDRVLLSSGCRVSRCARLRRVRLSMTRLNSMHCTYQAPSGPISQQVLRLLAAPSLAGQPNARPSGGTRKRCPVRLPSGVARQANRKA